MAVDVEIDEGIAVVTMNRPQVLNAFNSEQLDLLGAAFYALGQDRTVRAVILTGAGDRAFAAGADIKEMLDMSSSDMSARSVALSAGLGAMSRIPKPVVAAIAGYALGGGLEVALGCDWRVVSADAKLGQPEINLGVIPGGGGTQRLARLIGPARAKDLVMTGRIVDAHEALAMGLVDRVVPPGESVFDAAVALVRPLATGPAQALRAAKLAIDGGLELDLERGLQLESQLFAGLFESEDRREGMTAFVEKRKPTFTGR